MTLQGSVTLYSPEGIESRRRLCADLILNDWQSTRVGDMFTFWHCSVSRCTSSSEMREVTLSQKPLRNQQQQEGTLSCPPPFCLDKTFHEFHSSLAAAVYLKEEGVRAGIGMRLDQLSVG